MLNNKSILGSAISVLAVVGSLGVTQAAPLPDFILLGIDAGNGGGVQPCTVGSCFSMEIYPGVFAWVDVAPGTDGSIIVGKNQASGGQDTEPFGFTTPTSGEMTAAWSFFKAWGTFFADNSRNVFSDTSNDGTTVLNDFNMAWNGTITPLGGGTINDYTITSDGIGNATWSLDYSIIVPSGAFTGVPFRIYLTGNVGPHGDPDPPVVKDISITVESGVVSPWIPDFTESGSGYPHSCAIATNALNGNATVNADCSSGSYVSGAGYTGLDSFVYVVTDDGAGFQSTGTVTVNVLPPPDPACINSYPVKQMTTVGGGQSPSVNSTVQTTFTGHITTEAGLTFGSKNAVKVCSGTTVDYETISSVGTALCHINGVAVANTGSMSFGDKLICTNKPDGSDTDRFSVKNGL